MATVHTNLTVGKTYAVTSANGCTVTDADGNVVKVVKAGAQGSFVAQTASVELSDDDARLTLVFSGAPGDGFGGGEFDGHLDGSLYVGNGDEAAVAAVCTLTLGDLAQGGTLTDGTTVLELDAPPGVSAHGTAEYAEGGYMRLRGSVTDAAGRELVQVDVGATDNVDSLAGFLNAVSGMDAVMEFSNDGGALKATAVAEGAAGNGLKLLIEEIASPWTSIEITLSGGADGVYSVADIVSAINAESDFDVTAAAGEEENTVTLTASTAGKAANAVTYTATGCFGSGTTRQGSTTRGKDAVDQTDYKVYVNGEELFGESTVVVDAVEANNANAVTSNAVWNAIQEIDVDPAPLPTALTPTTAMKNGGVYTVEAAYTATTLSLPANATAEIWVRIGAAAFNVSLPASWVWVNGEAADMTGKTNTTFCIAVRNDGARVLASMAYSYDTTPAQS